MIIMMMMLHWVGSNDYNHLGDDDDDDTSVEMMKILHRIGHNDHHDHPND